MLAQYAFGGDARPRSGHANGYAHLPITAATGPEGRCTSRRSCSTSPLGTPPSRLAGSNTVAIEPILQAGTSRYQTKKDGWSVVTAGGKRAAHFEHTMAVSAAWPEM